MDITYLGVGCARLAGKQLDVLVDPYDDSAGLGKLKVNADVTLLTGPNKGTTAGMVIDSPGEYEVKGAMITGVAARLHSDTEDKGQRSTIYAIELDEIKVAILGNIAPELSDGQIEKIGSIDVLIIPVGGFGLTLDSTAASQLVSRLEPKVVVPVHYADKQTKYPMPQDGLKKFLEEMAATPEPVSKLKLTAKDLPEETTVVDLTRSGN